MENKQIDLTDITGMVCEALATALYLGALTHMALGKWATGVRFLVQAFCGMAMFVLFVWGVQILWGI